MCAPGESAGYVLPLSSGFEMGSCCSLADPEAAICGNSVFRARVTLLLCFLSLFMSVRDQLVPHYV